VNNGVVVHAESCDVSIIHKKLSDRESAVVVYCSEHSHQLP